MTQQMPQSFAAEALSGTAPTSHPNIFAMLPQSHGKLLGTELAGNSFIVVVIIETEGRVGVLLQGRTSCRCTR